jgi:hypothetical protein
MYPPLLRCLGKERLIQWYCPHLNYLHDFLADSDGSDYANLRGQGARGTKASATFKFFRFGSVKGTSQGKSCAGIRLRERHRRRQRMARRGLRGVEPVVSHADEGMKAAVKKVCSRDVGAVQGSPHAQLGKVPLSRRLG